MKVVEGTHCVSISRVSLRHMPTCQQGPLSPLDLHTQTCLFFGGGGMVGDGRRGGLKEPFDLLDLCSIRGSGSLDSLRQLAFCVLPFKTFTWGYGSHSLTAHLRTRLLVQGP